MSIYYLTIKMNGGIVRNGLSDNLTLNIAGRRCYQMVKTQNVDTKRLDEAIEKSGYRIGHIVDTLGISRQAFDMKKKGRYAFRQSEVYVLCDILNLSEEEKKLIFFP